jgi:transcription elongation factor GreA
MDIVKLRQMQIQPQMGYRCGSAQQIAYAGETVERIPMTREGYQTLKAELERIKRVDRPRNIRALEEARAHGDLSENAEFDAAKDRQGFIEGRINELEYKLANADVIDTDNLSCDRIVFGCRVVLENVETGKSVEYQLVGPDESDVDKGRISITSPLGRAMLGKSTFDEVAFQVPGGQRTYEVIEIR